MAKSSTVDKLFNELLVSIHDAKDFAVEQAPEIAKQMVAEEVAVNQVKIVSSVVVLTLSFLTVLFCIFGPEVKNWDNPSTIGLLGWSKLILGAFSGIGTVICTFELYESSIALMKLRVAPKVFLLKKLSKLARG